MSLDKNQIYQNAIAKLLIALSSGKAGLEQINFFVDSFAFPVIPELHELRVSLKCGILQMDSDRNFANKEQLADSPLVEGYEQRFALRQDRILHAYASLCSAYLSAFKIFQIIRTKRPVVYDKKLLSYVTALLSESSSNRYPVEEHTLMSLIVETTFSDIPSELADKVITLATQVCAFGYLCSVFDAKKYYYSKYTKTSDDFVKALTELRKSIKVV